jgi:serine/threonine protein kinase
VKHLLGSGSAGDTWLCQDRESGEVVAIKLIRRPIPPMMGTSIMREVKIGAELGKGHLNIVKPREVVLTRLVGRAIWGGARPGATAGAAAAAEACGCGGRG